MSRTRTVVQVSPSPLRRRIRTLLADLATPTRNTVRLGRDHIDIILATPTKVQRRAFDLPGVSLAV